MRKIGATALLSDHCKNRHLEIGPRILELQSFARNYWPFDHCPRLLVTGDYGCFECLVHFNHI
jgi:hypothetical protein